MKYLAIVGTDGPQSAEARAEMARIWPAYEQEMKSRGVWKVGRPLDIDEPPTTVRVRNERTLLTDGPFAETKEFVGGVDLLDCADLNDAIDIEGKSPVCRFLPIEVRPFADGVRLGGDVEAFGREEDTAGEPYLFSTWSDASDPPDHGGLARAYDGWQRELQASGQYVFGGLLAGPRSATTVRSRDGVPRLVDGPFLPLAEFVAGVDVVWCAGRQEATELAASHPFAALGAIELRPFDSQAKHVGRGAG